MTCDSDPCFGASGMPSLRTLSLSGTQITNAGVVELRKELLNGKVGKWRSSRCPTALPFGALVRIQRVERRGWARETGAQCPGLGRCDASSTGLATKDFTFTPVMWATRSRCGNGSGSISQLSNWLV